MKKMSSTKEMHTYAGQLKSEGKSIAFVPTMGFLHEGHLSLIREAKKHGDLIILSIFVNPKQFGANEDLESYPRNLERDLALCESEGVDIVFTPSTSDFYPDHFQTSVSVNHITQVLCGASRPTHFEGVTTVVCKLFNVVKADVAIFGQKDFQQCLVIQRMVEDLFIPTKIIIAPIVREKDGLAMSSRNKYLSEHERKDALVLSQTLSLAERLIAGGETHVGTLLQHMRMLILSVPSRIDYIEIRDPETLHEINDVSNGCVIALAIFIGHTRLIDNRVILSH